MLLVVKITVQLPDVLVEDARALAATEGTTLRDLIEAGLRHVIAERSPPQRGFRLRDASFAGNGLQPEFREGGWDRIRAAIHEAAGK